MSRGSIKKESNIPIAIVVAIVLIASAFFFLRPAPEQVVGISSDGLVRVEGVARGSDTLTIERLDGVQTTISPLVSPVYELYLESEGLLENGELTFSFSEFDSELPIQEIAVYQFDRETLSWVTLPTYFDLDSQTVTCELEFSGSVLVALGGSQK
jgi:hypothetical protein